MHSSENHTLQAALAINHLNEVIHDLRNDRDRFQLLLQNECLRREALESSAEMWRSECGEQIERLRAATEMLLNALPELHRDSPDLCCLEEECRLLAAHRTQLKGMEAWLRKERAKAVVRDGRTAPSLRRCSRLNHLSDSSLAALDVREPASEWGELACMSGGALRG